MYEIIRLYLLSTALLLFFYNVYEIMFYANGRLRQKTVSIATVNKFFKNCLLKRFKITMFEHSYKCKYF